MTSLTRALRIASVLLTGMVTSAHYGSRAIIYEGHAGPYEIVAVIEPPMVIPAQVTVLVEIKGGVPDSVTVQPVAYGLESSNAPAPDALRREAGDNQRFRGTVWLMTLGTYRFRLTVHGDQGEGTAVIPVPAILAGKPAWGAGSSLLLLAMGIGLIAGTLMVVKAIARDGLRSPGEPVTAFDDARARRAGREGMLVWAGISGVIAVWWVQLSAGYDARIFQPYQWNVSLASESGTRELRILLDDPRWRRPSARLLSDNGHPLHLFLIRSPALDVFAHLHPVELDSATYRVSLPPLPPGTYRVFGDLVHADGIPETLVDTLTLDNPIASPWVPVSEDDSWWTALDDTATVLRWAEPRGTLSAGSAQLLSFSLRDSTGGVLPHEPLMGMDGHAVVVREDLSVFVHLHPMGTVSMAAMEELALQDGVQAPHDMRHAGTAVTPVSFPWVFPSGGRYRVWGQTRSAGTIVTGAADFVAEEVP